MDNTATNNAAVNEEAATSIKRLHAVVESHEL